MKSEALHMSSPYSFGEEVANAVTHGIGALLSIAALVIMVAFAVLHGDAWLVTSVSIYGATLILLYTSSTLYHAIAVPAAKIVLQKIDHATIFLLIAGTYTPFLLVNLRGPWGWALFGLVWGIALFGVILELGWTHKSRKISLALYLGLGWIIIIAIGPMLEKVEPGGLLLLLLGGISYTLGVVFYVWRTMTYHHAIWHLFVLLGSALHFFSIFFYVIPDAPVA